MWTIRQLKERGKTAFKRNYWKSVLVALLISVLAAGGGSSAATGVSSAASNVVNKYEEAREAFLHAHRDKNDGIRYASVHDGVHRTYQYVEDSDFDDFLEWYMNERDGSDYYDDDYYFDYDDDYYDYDYDYDDYYWDDDDYYWDDDFYYEDDDFFDGPAFWAFMAVFLVLFIIIFIIALAIAVVMDVFIYNPLEMGTSRFFFKNLSQAADVKEVAYGFDRSYKNVISTLFFRDLYRALWTLLFIIPGIVKSYEYRMIPYILSEYPNMPREQVFATSRQMMMGEKWRAFVLDLSFIGWNILDVFTLGILGIFYVGPYYHSTCAALYEALKYQKGTESSGYQVNDAYNPPVVQDEPYVPKPQEGITERIDEEPVTGDEPDIFEEE